MCRPRGVADDLRQSRPGREVKARPDVFALIWNLRLERCLASKGVSARNRSARSCSAAGLEGFGRHAGEQTHPHRQMTRTDKTAALFGPTFREYSSLRLETFFRPVGSRFRQYPAP